MPDDILPFDRTRSTDLSRRTFAALSLGAGAAVTASAMAADQALVETDVVIKMADGNCDAALFHPSGNGSWSGAVIFADALGRGLHSVTWDAAWLPKATPLWCPTRSIAPARRPY
jgi:hypothetical protein